MILVLLLCRLELDWIMNLHIGRFDLIFKDQLHTITEHMFVVSTRGVSVQEVLNVHTGMRCPKQQSTT